MAKGPPNKRASKSGVAAARGSSVRTREIPWGTVGAVVGIVALAAVVFGYYLVESAPQRAQEQRDEAAAEFAPTADNPDPSEGIEGITIEQYEPGVHIAPPQRVAFDHSPPIGGPHDAAWAACNGVVYDEPVRSESLVHSLEHGAVWIAYDPEQLDEDEVDELAVRVEGNPYTVMSPYPELDEPISMQSWGHQLKLAETDDERIEQFIAALRQNANTHPEVRGSCDALGPGQFDPDDPPEFQPIPSGDEPEAVPMDPGQEDLVPGDGAIEDPGDLDGEVPEDAEEPEADDEDDE